MALDWVKLGNLKGPKGDVGTWWQRNLGSSTNIDAMTSADAGAYSILSGTTAGEMGLPKATPSSFEVLPVGTGLIQIQRTLAPVSEVWQRELYANGEVWGDWRRTDHHKETTEFDGLLPATPGSLAQTAISITTGHGGGQTTGQGFVRGLQRIPAGATRARIGIRNWNPRYNMADSPAAALSNISLGRHNGGTSQSLSWVSVQSSGSTGTEGFLSRWVNLPEGMAGTDVLVAFGWQSSGDVQNNIGYGFTGGSASNAIIGTGAAANTLPFFIYLEVEIPAEVPRLAVFGDSISSGVSASKVMYDSWLDQYCRPRGIVPQHWSHSGDQGDSWADPQGKKWSLYGKDIVQADAVLYAMGSNMIFRPTTPTLQECIDVTVDNIKNIRKHISPNVYGATILPRTAVTGAGETLRRQYNAWMKASPLFRDVFDMSAAVSLDDETLNPAYDADGIHLNTAGYAAMAAAISRLLVEPFQRYAVSETAGRVVKVWDPINQREQLLRGDTGIRDIASLIKADYTVGGECFLTREGSMVHVAFNSLSRAVAGTGNIPVIVLPPGFTPITNIYGSTFRGNRCALQKSGNIYITDPTISVDYLDFTFRTTDPWPTSLPGTAVGIIPYQ